MPTAPQLIIEPRGGFRSSGSPEKNSDTQRRMREFEARNRLPQVDDLRGDGRPRVELPPQLGVIHARGTQVGDLALRKGAPQPEQNDELRYM